MTTREINREGKRFANALAAAIDSLGDDLPANHLRPQETADGKIRYEGKYIDKEVIDIMERQGGWNKSQIETLRQISEVLEEGIGHEFLNYYFKATKQGGAKYLTAKGAWKTDVPIGISLTKDGNVIIRVMSVDKFHKNLNYLFSRRKREVERLWGTDESHARIQMQRDIAT